ncbi:DMT family transporter [Pseudothermotoga sp. U03pept]|uniref:DMT family transporter n=1 Tax=Pseudothermotoga sp. U03pept TaxID=3447012 RepID=UPI003F091F02
MREILLLITAIIANALANVFVKVGAPSLETKGFKQLLLSTVKNVYIWLGLFCFGLAFIFYTMVLTKAKLSVAYPVMTSAGFVIVSLFSYFLFKETFSLWKILGILIIAIGIWIISTT